MSGELYPKNKKKKPLSGFKDKQLRLPSSKIGKKFQKLAIFFGFFLMSKFGHLLCTPPAAAGFCMYRIGGTYGGCMK
jgi:hypothetical protein